MVDNNRKIEDVQKTSNKNNQSTSIVRTTEFSHQDSTNLMWALKVTCKGCWLMGGVVALEPLSIINLCCLVYSVVNDIRDGASTKNPKLTISDSIFDFVSGIF